MYSRISNPTNAVLEQRVSALEGGIGAIATASGQAALHLSIATLMGAGSHIVASTALSGGSQNLLHYTMRRFGIATTFVKPGDLNGWRSAVQPNTKLFWRNGRQPWSRCAGYFSRGEHSLRIGCAVAGRCHTDLTMPHQTLRSWRRSGVRLFMAF